MCCYHKHWRAITNKGRNRWGEGFMQDYQAVAHVEILPKVPAYPLRPAVSFCKGAAASHMCPQGPTLPGQHRVAFAHMFWGNSWTEILEDTHRATRNSSAMGSILGSGGLEYTLHTKGPEAPAMRLLHKGLICQGGGQRRPWRRSVQVPFRHTGIAQTGWVWRSPSRWAIGKLGRLRRRAEGWLKNWGTAVIAGNWRNAIYLGAQRKCTLISDCKYS